MTNSQISADAGSVIWAVDPFDLEQRPLSSSVNELMQWTERAGLRLLPVHVLSPTEKQLEAGEIPPLATIEAELRRYLHRYSLALGEEVQPRVLFDQTSSRRGAIEALQKLASAERAEWIAVSSHGRSGMERLVLGSFVESLLQESLLPVLVLARRPRTERTKMGKRALFAAEFSVADEDAFTRFLKHAKALRLDLIIYHLLAYPIPSMDLGFGSTIPENFYAEQERWAKERGSVWVQKARDAGVKARFVLGDGGVPALTGKLILERARDEGARLIAMASLTGAFTRLVEGSPAHQIFRAGRFPVWIYGPASVSGDAHDLKARDINLHRAEGDTHRLR